MIERHHQAATVLTSNRDPSEWLAVMADPLLAQSAVDRLKSAAWKLVIEGESYRKREKPTLHPSPEPGRRRGALDSHGHRPGPCAAGRTWNPTWSHAWQRGGPIVLASDSLVGPHAPVLGPPAVPGAIGDLEVAHHRGDVLALIEQALALSEPAQDLLGRCRCRFIDPSRRPSWWASDSHNWRTSSSGAPSK